MLWKDLTTWSHTQRLSEALTRAPALERLFLFIGHTTYLRESDCIQLATDSIESHTCIHLTHAVPTPTHGVGRNRPHELILT